MKQRDDAGISHKKRIIGAEKGGSTTKKVTIKEDDVREGEDFDENGATLGKGRGTPNMNSKKTKLAKDLKQLEDLTQTSNILGSLKVEDKKVKKSFDVGVITPKTIEALLRFLGIEPDDNAQVMNSKLNLARIEVKGQKPTKMKKLLKPESKIQCVLNDLELETITEGGKQV
jgi:hypothetical protein